MRLLDKRSTARTSIVKRSTGSGGAAAEQPHRQGHRDRHDAAYPRILRQLTDPERFPALTAFIAAGVFEAEDGPDDEFIFGLDRILDGIEVLIQPGRRPG